MNLLKLIIIQWFIPLALCSTRGEIRYFALKRFSNITKRVDKKGGGIDGFLFSEII